MKPGIHDRFVFVTRSLMWSVLLYCTLMLVFNWEDVSNKVRGINPITVVSDITVQPPFSNTTPVVHPNIGHNPGIITGLINLIGSLHVPANSM